MRREGRVDQGSPLRLSQQWSFWMFCALVVGCAATVLVNQSRYFATYPAAWVLSIALLAVTAVPAGIILYRLDELEPEPASLIAMAVIWGGVVAVTFAAIANGQMNSFLQHVVPARTVDSWAASLTAPINEEFYKGLGLVLIYLTARREIDHVMDGLVYGAMIGLGFQVMENVQYFMVAAAGQDGSPSAVVSLFFLRVVVSGLYSHMLFSGFIGFGFAYFVVERMASLRRRIGVLVGCVVLSWASHFVWNSPWLERLMATGTVAFAAALVIKGLPFLVLLVLLGVFADRRQKRVFGCLMREEVGGELVTEEEFEILRSRSGRSRALRRMRRQEGWRARAQLKQLMREQIGLALLHSRSSLGDQTPLEEQRKLIMATRVRLAALTR